MIEQENKTKYSVRDIKNMLDTLSGEYDLARVVDPIECRILNFEDDGIVNISERCYGIWNAGHKCTNCSSAKACHTGCGQHKAERFNDKIFQIDSNPVTVQLVDGGTYEAIIELVNIEEISEDIDAANDREAENVDHAAAQYRAAHDDLTQVLSADAFYELSRDIIIKAPDEKWMMITSNIMNFKLVNTLFGETKGNEVLIKCAEMLKSVSIEADGVCGRVGSDQFAMLVTQNKYDEDVLISVKDVLADAFNCGIYTFVLHFGVYQVSNPSTPISVMCGRANSALSTIKESVRDIVAYFDDAILEKTIFEQAVIGGFNDALEHGQFKMFLQPLVGSDGKTFGAEALARWVKPDGTVVMPGDFIEILESAGLVHELDMHIWECAVKQLSEWKNTNNQHLTISVNMSAKDLFNVDVYEVLCNLIERYQVDANKLCLEITETALLEDPASSKCVIAKLRERGFIVEIDDFGKGYSSLSMLKDIHADVLKIDMSLLQEIESKYRSKVILQSIINMANDLGMNVITEGIETQTQLSALTNMGCHLFQGYYFAKPMPIPEFEKTLVA